MEGWPLEESGWYYGSSDNRGSSERRHTKSERVGLLWTSAGVILYPTPISLLSSLSFEWRKYRKIFTVEVVSLDFRTWLFSDILALARWCWSLFKSRRSEKIFSEFSLEYCSRYGAIMILSVVSRLQPSAMMSGICGGCRSTRGDLRSYCIGLRRLFKPTSLLQGSHFAWEFLRSLLLPESSILPQHPSRP